MSDFKERTENGEHIQCLATLGYIIRYIDSQNGLRGDKLINNFKPLIIDKKGKYIGVERREQEGKQLCG